MIVEYINFNFCNQTKGDLIGNSFYNFIPESFIDEVRQCFNNIYQNVKPDEIFIDFVQQDGKNKKKSFYINPLLKEGEIENININLKDEILYLVSVHEDITEPKEIEEKLYISEQKYKDLTENIPDTIWETQSDGKTTYVSPNVLKLTGYTSQEIITNQISWFEMVHRDNLDFVKISFEKLITEKIEFDIEYRIKKKDGTWVWLHDRAISAYEKEGMIYARGLVSDVTHKKNIEEALKLSEEKFSLVFMSSPTLYGISRLEDGKYLEVNDTFCKKLKFSREEVIGKTSVDLKIVTPENRKKLKNSVIKHGQLNDYEINLFDKIGNELTGLISVEPMEFGGEKCLVTSVVDITKRKIVEKELIKSEEKFRVISEQSLMGIAIIQDGLWKYSNQAQIEIIGYTHEEIMNWKPGEFLKVVHPDDREFAKEQVKIKQMGADGAITNYKFKSITKTGIQKTLELYSHTIQYDGKPADLAIVVDITDRMKTKEALAAEKERLAVTLRSIGDGVIATDKNGKIVLMNMIAESLTGYIVEEAKNRPIEEIFNIFDETTNTPLENPVHSIIKFEKIIRLTRSTILISKKGIRRIINESGAPIRDKNGNIIGVIIVFRDITKQRSIEIELIKKERIESVGLLAGGIAHDFNNILMSILGHLSLLKLNIDKNTELYSSIIEAEKGTLRARDLTKQLLTFSKGGDPIKKISFIDKIIKNSATFSLHGLSINYELICPPNIWPINADRGQIGQVIQNLVLNAAQSMNNKGNIIIKVKNNTFSVENSYLLDPGKYIGVSVIDTGTGISEDELSKIFDPYYTTKSTGSGLGLSICHSIVNKHHGMIFVDSKIGKGSTFTFFIPAEHSTVIHNNNKPESISKRIKTKILVLEDDPNVNNVIRLMFKQLNIDFEITLDGFDTLEIYEKALKSKNPFDIVILDLTIQGGKGGDEIIDDLIKINPDVNAIVSSGYSTGEFMSNYSKYGFKGVLMKPYTISDLLKSINNVLKEEVESFPFNL